VEPTRFEHADGMLLAGLRRYHRFEQAREGTEQQWREFAASPIEPAHKEAFGAICRADQAGLEYLTGLRVDSFDGLPEGTGRMRVPPQRYAVFLHTGAHPVSESWRRVFAWLSDGPYQSAETPDFERCPDIASRLMERDVEIWIGVKER
jgi:AraC family transcriptional regulator